MTPDIKHRLQILFDNLYPAGGEPYSISRVAQLASSEECPVTAQQIHGILSGRTKRPSFATVAALASFFKVPLEFFSTTDETAWRSYETHVRTLHSRVNDTSLLAARTNRWYDLREQRRKKLASQSKNNQ
jgi:hypothetical protein